jgi:outer membrane protein assembly factor BamE
MRFTPLFLLAVLVLPACGLIEVDRLDVDQGNRLEPEEIEAVELGMNRTQVLEILGTPVLESPFHADRWDYIYYRTEAGLEVEETPRRLTIHFEDDAVVRIEDRFTKTAENGNEDGDGDGD